jgi:hypothetical protein
MIGNNLEGSGRGLFEVLSQYFPGGTEGTHEKLESGWTARSQFLARERDFSLLHNVQTGSGAHTVSYPMGTMGIFPGGKAALARS